MRNNKFIIFRLVALVVLFTYCFGSVAFSMKYSFLEKQEIPDAIMPKDEFKEFDHIYSGAELDVNYKSRFLGYQHLIDRDIMYYGDSLRQEQYDDKKWSDICTLCDMDDDGLSDIVSYDNKKLYWYKNLGDTSFGDALELMDVPEISTFLVADINADKKPDVVICDMVTGTIEVSYLDNERKVFARSLFESNELVNICDETTKVDSGDFNGDRYYDVIAVNNDGKYIILYSDGTGRFEKTFIGNLSFMGEDITDVNMFSTGDFNSDKLADIVLKGSSAYREGVLYLFTRFDDTFGPKESEKDDIGVTNLYGKIEWNVPTQEIDLISGLLNNDDMRDLAVIDKDMIRMRYMSGEAAYDYSFHLIKEGGLYKCYSGARWATKSVSGDGDHAIYSESRDGGLTWFRNIKDPCFYKPRELGIEDTWWGVNSMDPEVVKIGGVYYMYTQQQINPGNPLDTGEIAVKQSDRIMLSTSLDGENFQPHPERSVVVNVTDGTSVNVHHHEVIYVPDDPDGRPWWFYFVAAGSTNGTYRIRSADPTTFDWNNKERLTSSFSQIGNQIGYIDEAPGGRLFIRPTFIRGKGPAMQVSRDGLSWTFGDGETPTFATIDPEAERVPEKNRDTFFLGIATENGTGRILPEKDGTYRLLIATTSCTAPTAPTIFSAEGGLLEVIVSFK